MMLVVGFPQAGRPLGRPLRAALWDRCGLRPALMTPASIRIIGAKQPH